MRTLVAGPLSLEPQVADHAEALYAVLLDPAIYEFENEPPESLEWLRGRLGRLETRCSADGSEQWLNWVVRHPDLEVIGYVQATVYPNASADIAYVFGSAHWGQGLAHEAVSAMIQELRSVYGVARLQATFKRPNHRSQRLLERLGFAISSPETHQTQAVEPDEWMMEMSMEEAANPATC